MSLTDKNRIIGSKVKIFCNGDVLMAVNAKNIGKIV